jgi:hypothetical protein
MSIDVLSCIFRVRVKALSAHPFLAIVFHQMRFVRELDGVRDFWRKPALMAITTHATVPLARSNFEPAAF